MKRFILPVIFLLLGSCPSFGQSGWYGQVHYGRMLEIKSSWPEIRHNALILSGGFSTRPSGRHKWHHLFGFPETGVRGMFFFPGNAEIFGHGFSILPTISIPLKETRNFQLRYTTGYSLGILTRPYHRTRNPGNNVIGSPVNYYVLFQLESRWRLMESWFLNLNVDYSHFSNSRTEVPNLGINIPAVSLGLRKENPLRSPGLTRLSGEIKTWSRFQPGIRLGLGLNSQKAPGGPVYPVYVGSAYLSRVWKEQIRFKAGTEWFFSQSILGFIRNQDIMIEDDQWASTGGIVFVGSEFLLGKLAIVVHLGPYIKRAYQMDYLLYTKFGTQYYLFNQQHNPYFQPFLGAYVHAHSGEADFAEFALGFVF